MRHLLFSPESSARLLSTSGGKGRTNKVIPWCVVAAFRLAFPGDGLSNHLRAWIFALLLLAGAFGLNGCSRKEPAKPIDYSTTNEVSIVLGEVNRNFGLRQAKVDHDGTTTPDTIGGLNCHFAKAGAWNSGYIYFVVDPSFKATNCHKVKLSVQYFDAANGYFEIQYDANDPSAPGAGSYTVCPKKIPLEGKQEWDVEDFVLEDVRFDNSQNGNADFRIHFKTKKFYLSDIIITRLD